MDGRFRLTKVVRVDRKDDGNEIHDKVFDYSHKTIEDLMKVGYNDASVQMDMQCIREGILELAKINSRSRKGQENHQMDALKECFHKIEEKMKIENGNRDQILGAVENLMSEIESIKGVTANNLLLEVKEFLVTAAKQLQDTIDMITTKNQQKFLLYPSVFKDLRVSTSEIHGNSLE